MNTKRDQCTSAGPQSIGTRLEMIQDSIKGCVATLENPAPEDWEDAAPRVANRLAVLAYDLQIIVAWIQTTPCGRFEFVERFPSSPPRNSWNLPEGRGLPFEANHLAARMRETGISQEDLAQAAGIDVSKLDQLEAGFSFPSVNMAQRIAARLGTSVSSIWNLDKEGEQE